jgi:hypothetical protein
MNEISFAGMTVAVGPLVDEFGPRQQCVILHGGLPAQSNDAVQLHLGPNGVGPTLARAVLRALADRPRRSVVLACKDRLLADMVASWFIAKGAVGGAA